MLFLFPAQRVGVLPHSLRAQPVLKAKHYSFKSHNWPGDSARLLALTESLWKTRHFCLHGETGWTTSRERKATPSPLFSLQFPGKPSSRGMGMPFPQPLGNWRPPEMCLSFTPTLLHCKAHPTPGCCGIDPAWVTPTTGTKHCQTQQTLPRPLLWWAERGLGCFIPQSLRTVPL